MKKLKITALIMLILICLTQGGVFAMYQSSPNVTPITATQQTWLVNIRKMEAAGKVMGFNETLASTATLLPTSSNNIDVHMQKNTEYGAMLILAISDYGKQGNGTTGSDYIYTDTYGLATSTGNTSGIYQLANKEWVAAGVRNSKYSAWLNNANARYVDGYSTSVSYKRGDALNIATWQGGSSGGWFVENSVGFFDGSMRYQYFYFLVRKNFSYDGRTSWPYNTKLVGEHFEEDYSRACIVQGEGF